MSTAYNTINNCAINNDIREMVISIAEKSGFQKFHLEITDGIKGSGYTGIAKTVRIHNSNNLKQTLNLYVKSASNEKSARDDLPIADMFRTEMYIYNTIFPHFKALEICKGLAPSTFMPNFFGSILNNENEVVILENLSEIGYRMHDSYQPWDSQHIRLVITEYAKYHSLSFALRNQQPKMFEKLPTKLNKSYLEMIHTFKDVVVNKCTTVLNFLNETDSKKVRNFLQNYDRELKELLFLPIDEYSVILHGDCWMNNILFQYSEGSCDPIDVCLIDYQLARLAPPVLDLAYVFFANSSEQEINKCNEYLELYYQVLSTHLQKLGCDSNKLYPYSVFKKQWYAFAKCSVIFTPIALLVMMSHDSESEDVLELSKTCLTLSETFNRDTTNDTEYNRRFKSVISYLVKNNLL